MHEGPLEKGSRCKALDHSYWIYPGFQGIHGTIKLRVEFNLVPFDKQRWSTFALGTRLLGPLEPISPARAGARMEPKAQGERFPRTLHPKGKQLILLDHDEPAAQIPIATSGRTVTRERSL